jgi:hypothetical protein
MRAVIPSEARDLQFRLLDCGSLVASRLGMTIVQRFATG